MMPELPESTWLHLSEAADLISRMCGCSIKDARKAVVGAIRDGQVPARGTLPNPAYKKALAAGFPGGFGGLEYKSAFSPLAERPLKPELFRQHNLDWQTNTLGEASDVEVNRVSLLQWLGGVEGVQNPTEAAPEDGDPPSHPTVDGPTIEAPEPETDAHPETHSGLSGRPSAKHLYEQELERRIEDGETLEETAAEEARTLHKWMRGEHPDLNPGTARTIENNIRAIYVRAKTDRENPTK